MRTYRLVTVCALALLCGGLAHARVLHVSSWGNDANDGLSWSRAKRTIGGALSVASEGDQIWVRRGVFAENITLKNGVDLYGGFVGNEVQLSQRRAFPRPSPDHYETVIDGGQRGAVIRTPSAAFACRVDGFTIRNGEPGMSIGGARGSVLTVANCTIAGNRAATWWASGGGVWVSGGVSATFTDRKSVV